VNYKYNWTNNQFLKEKMKEKEWYNMSALCSQRRRIENGKYFNNCQTKVFLPPSHSSLISAIPFPHPLQ
jgi:hypothetical protein